jgi:hypothetical protein
MDIAAWLRGLGLEQYAQLFRDNDIDGEILGGMNAEDLKELGISSFGHRRRLLNAITALGLCAKIGLFQSSRSVFVQASISARNPIAGESNHALSASGGISKARTSKIAPTRTRIPR